MDKKEQTRLRVQRYRDKQKGVTQDKDVTQDVTQETVPASYVQGLKGKYQSLPERPRYLTLSDNQVLGRLNPPTIRGDKPSGDFRACNESSYNYKPRKR